jgi:flagellar motor switch protein FliM
MLRDPEATIGEGGEMSALEQSILLDILTASAEGLIEALTEYAIEIVKTDQLVQGEWPMRFREFEEMTRFDFHAECGAAKLQLGVCLRDEELDGAAGVIRAKHSPEEIKKYPERVVTRMHDASMQVTAQLSSAMMTLSDLLSLEAGDVVVLGQKADCPISMRVNGQTCFKGWPAQRSGRLAVQVTGLDQ